MEWELINASLITASFYATTTNISILLYKHTHQQMMQSLRGKNKYMMPSKGDLVVILQRLAVITQEERR